MAVVNVITETIEETGPQGAPEGPLYAALMGHMSLSTFQAIVGALVGAGKIRKSGNVLYSA